MTNESPLTNATEAQRIEAVEANFHSWFRSMVRVLNGELEETPRLNRYHCSPGSPIFKGVWNAHLVSHEVDTTIDETISWFKERNTPFFFWWIGETTQPADLGERLKAHGFAEFEINATEMVADIDPLNWDNPRPVDLHLDPVLTEEQLLQFKQTFLESFGIPEWAGQAWVDATHAIGFGRAPWTLLLGTLHGEPVCFGLRSPYLKLGFRDTGRRLSRYIWRNS